MVIYALYDLEKPGAVYVGRTVAPQRRLRQHVNLARRDFGSVVDARLNPWAADLYGWLMEIIAEEREPTLRILQQDAEVGCELAWMLVAERAGWSIRGMSPKLRSALDRPSLTASALAETLRWPFIH